ncbi:hypothetical protein BH11ARM2_BH11ARM2_25710 [soil metagenome]
MRVLGSYAVVYVQNGGGGYRDANGVRQVVRAGDAIVLFPELPHAYGPRLLAPRAPREWNETYVLFSGAVFDILRTTGVLRTAHPVIPTPVGWGSRFQAFVEAHQTPTVPAQALRFASLIAELVPDEPQPAPTWSESAQASLAHNLQAPLELPELAASFGLSPDAFRKRFVRETGTTPARYRAERRMEAAETLLRETRMPLRAVAEALGYVDEFHLSHAYKRARGVPPSSVRRS